MDLQDEFRNSTGHLLIALAYEIMRNGSDLQQSLRSPAKPRTATPEQIGDTKVSGDRKRHRGNDAGKQARAAGAVAVAKRAQTKPVSAAGGKAKVLGVKRSRLREHGVSEVVKQQWFRKDDGKEQCGNPRTAAPEQISDTEVPADGNKKRRHHFSKVCTPWPPQICRPGQSRSGSICLHVRCRLGVLPQSDVARLEAEYRKLSPDAAYGPLSEALGKSLRQDPQRIKCAFNCPNTSL